MSYSITQADLARNDLAVIAREYEVIPLADPIINSIEFYRGSGSSKPTSHHYGKHGLIIHTHEVVKLCCLNLHYCESLAKTTVNPAAMYLAALYHDFGKIYDYEERADNEWVKTDYAREIHHVTSSVIFWNTIYNQHRHDTLITDELSYAITHAMLAHHGQRSWGSPVSPNTQMAWLLHLCDAMSARMDDCTKSERPIE